MANNKHTHINH